MIKKLLITAASALLGTQYVQAQQLLGIANSNYAGTNGIYMNPSSIADSRYTFHLNMFTFDGLVTNNYLRYSGPNFAESLANDDFGKDNAYLQERLNGKPKMFTLAGDVRMPSFMVRLSAKHSFAVASRFRTAVQGNSISEDILKLIKYGADNDGLQNVYNNSHFGFNVNSFLETGLTYGRVILDKDKHFLKGGVTVKKLTGIYSAHLINKELNYTIKEDTEGNPMLEIQRMDMRMGYSRGSFEIDPAASFGSRNAPGKGWGMDLGFTYEYRPAIDNYRYTLDGEEGLDNSKNKYKYRVGVALMDIGGIRYNDSGLSRSYTVARQNVSISAEDIENSDSDNIDDLLVDVLDIKASEQATSFKSGLPTALHLTFDYRIANRLYVNTSIIQGLRGKYGVSMRQNSMVAVTPRVEMKWLEVSFPLALMNNHRDFALGTMLKVGPLFVGSDNISGVVGGGKPFGTNVYAGMVIPIFKGKIKDKDKDGVSNKKDECKSVPGTWELKGCPEI
ncbi:DUF5723 family protein [Rhodocytophaga aerolata]|uniref:DUF5723 family protein n=1 Tax=Rhodocytophaga aerolata TaxID=455078 RepID=A0ABT8R7D4_9BACT|nr:DUF5723 family protein [Rhodocytophaga aerolata]MDO1448020.1 DUF5723 family protein [Rhodocytophaga aerolata]